MDNQDVNRALAIGIGAAIGAQAASGGGVNWKTIPAAGVLVLAGITVDQVTRPLYDRVGVGAAGAGLVSFLVAAVLWPKLRE